MNWVKEIKQILLGWCLDAFALQKKINSITDFKNLCRRMKKDNIIAAKQLTSIIKILELGNLRARDIMIPRADMISISINSDRQHIKTQVQTSGHSRFPVVDEENKKVLGVIVSKDVFVTSGKKSLQGLLRKALFVPENRRLTDLLNDFQQEHQHLAIVVDEYGDASGLVTIEDIIEEITGNIEDEHDLKHEKPLIEQKSECHYMIQAKTPITEFNRHFNSELSNDSMDTMGGLMLQYFGYIPTVGEKTRIQGFEFTIVKATTRQIITIDVQTLPSGASDQ